MKKGITQDPLGTINLIQDNLHDRYGKGFPIVKELVQNADDANATASDSEAVSLHLGWTRGFPQIDHPLLQSPALFVVNDGKFDNKDARAIRQFGMSYKGAEKATIGKFGLGIKSVFHLCEAFFFWRHGDDIEIVNPWSVDDDELDLHADWNQIEPIANQVQEAIQKRLRDCLSSDRWFCLWIPLRQKCHNPDPIMGYYPGDRQKPSDEIFDELFDKDVSIQLAKVLPMLRCVRRVQGWIIEGDDSPLREVFDVTLGNSAQCRLYPEMNRGTESDLIGKVNIAALSNRSLPFGGIECFLQNDTFDDIQASSFWPQARTRNPETGAAEMTKDKAHPHCAAYFIETPANSDKGSLTIRWAVFLPMGDSERRSCDVACDFTLTLHGYFFPDAGRANIDFGADEITDEVSLRKAWNSQLKKSGTLPLILPALKRFVEVAKLSDAKIKALTEALQPPSSFFDKADYTHICKRGQFLYRLTSDGMAWELLGDSNQDVFEIPNPPESAPDRPLKVFPRLKPLSQRYAITFCDYPRLAPHSRPAKWRQDLLAQLFEISVADVFGSQANLTYFVDFLQDCLDYKTRFNIANTLRQIGGKAFNTVELSQLRRHKSEVQRFLGFLPPPKRFVIQTAIPASVMQELFKLELSVLLIPKIFAPEEKTPQSPTRFSADDGVKILEFLANPPSRLRDDPDFLKVRTAIVLEVLRASEWELIRHRFGGWKLFRAYNCTSRHDDFLSLNELNQMRRNGTLFVYSNPPNKFGRAMQLQQAFDRVSVVLVESAIRDTFGWKDIPSCNATQCYNLIEGKPNLNSPQQRVNLLDALLPTLNNNPRYCKSLRYLIHGHQQDNNELLFVLRETVNQTLWRKITEQVLRLKEDLWRLIPTVLGDRIALLHRPPLNIKEIDSGSVAGLISEVDATKIDCTSFTANERNILLQEIEDLEVLRWLRIYENVNGNPVIINEEVSYWEGDFPWERVPLHGISILRNLEPTLRGKQDQLLDRSLDAEAAIRILLQQNRPSQDWRVIMDAIKQVEDIDELTEVLQKENWLPIDEGRAPADMIYLKGLEDDVARVMSGLDRLFVEVTMLPGDFQTHSAFEILADGVFPPAEDALKMLGKIMASDEKYHIGDLDTFNLNPFLFAFKQAESHLIPAYSMIQNVAETQSCSDCNQYLLPNLQREIPTTRTIQILNYLSKSHETASPPDRPSFLEVHNWYLSTAVKTSRFNDILPQIRLLNRRGRWKSSSQLCFDAHGITPNDLLDGQQGEIVKAKVEEYGSDRQQEQEPESSDSVVQNLDQQLKAGTERLRTYFQAWSGTVPDAVIGGFLCLLGDQPEMLQVAHEYLERANRTLENTRERFDWKSYMWHMPNRPDMLSGDRDKDMRRHRFIIDVTGAKTHQVKSLVGTAFEARISQKGFKHLFVGSKSEKVSNFVYQLTLREIDLASHSEGELSGFLLESTRQLLQYIYVQSTDTLDELWEELAESEQLSIQIAQNLLLEFAFGELMRLGIEERHAQIGQLKRDWHAAHTRREEENQNPKGGTRTAEKDLRNIQGELKALLESDEQTQAIILDAVREKINAHFQYKPQSVPFELFQNADDAVVELSEMRGGDGFLTSEAIRFVICDSDRELSFIHWGRPINKFALAPFDGRERGYNRDLENMLMLHASNKSNPQRMVTGKFGLGFKSVYLVTSKPKVVSERLGFEVVGGMFPRRLIGDEFNHLQNKLRQIHSENRAGTIITLPIEDVLPTEVLADFMNLADILTVFARKIRHCEFRGVGGESNSVSWSERPLPHTQSVFTGTLQSASNHNRDGTTAIVIRSGQGNLLLVLDSRKFSRLSDDVPTIWVTAPTKEKLALGFAINGQFELNIGRSQLASENPKNTQLAESLGVEIGGSLVELFDASSDWDGFCEALNIVKDTLPYDFWESLWRLLGTDSQKKQAESNETSHLVSMILWRSRHHGMGRLICSRPALPSGLWGNYRDLVQMDSVRFRTVGILGTENVFQVVSTWKTFRDHVKCGEIVSDDRVYSILRSLLGGDVPRCMSIDLRRVLEWEIDSSRCVDAAQASRLGKLMTREFLSQLKAGNQSEKKEHEALIDFLREVRFRGGDGNHHPANELLIASDNDDNPDEPRRSNFAPDDRIIASNYTGDALEFFIACRDELSAPAKLMAEWALATADDEKRIAILRYLLKGELRYPLAEEIRQQRRYDSWLNQVNQNDLWKKHFDVNKLDDLLWILRLDREETPPEPETPFTPPPRPNHGQVLERIYDWWVSEKETRIQAYETDVYGTSVPNLSDEPKWCKSQTREPWLTLLILGSLHTMGMMNTDQHRAFLQRCQENRWFEVFANPYIDRTAWMGVLEQFLDSPEEKIEFYHWMRQFVSIFQFARWLGEYGDAFLAIETIQHPFSLDQITRPKYSEIFQPGGPDAPSIDRALGLGACFVVRELLRKRVITNPYAYEHCYVPIKRVRDLLSLLGCRGFDENTHNRWNQSKDIYQFLSDHLGDRATFDLSFDIPFLVIAKDKALHRKFFDSDEELNEDDDEEYE